MRRFLMVCIALMAFEPLFSQVQPVYAQSTNNGAVESYNGRSLCLPGVYLQDGGDCLPLGPSEYLTKNAQNGIPYPQPVMAMNHPDASLASVPYLYTLMTKEPIPVYASLADAQNKNSHRTMGPGYIYLSYTDRADTPEGIFYQIQTTEWVDGLYVAGRIYPNNYKDFQGFSFLETPKNNFGWILDDSPSWVAPGYNSPKTGKTYKRFDVVNVYGFQSLPGMDWVMIGPDEWVEKRYIARVIPNVTPPQGVTGTRWIEVNLYDETLTVYDQGKLIFVTMISSGLDPFFTKPGLFKIYKKKDSENMTGSFASDKSDFYYLEDVPWTMYYDEARALHGAYWHARFGYPISHGCVNISIPDAHWLFNWAKEGDWVYVWDPSGKTPTDSSAYGSGGF